MDIREIGWGVWSGFTWLGSGANGGLSWMRWWTFDFWRHGISYKTVHTILRLLLVCLNPAKNLICTKPV
jgi:hypothetical protein